MNFARSEKQADSTAHATSRSFRGERRDSRGLAAPVQDWVVAGETAIEIRLNGEPQAVMMATPADHEDFATGFLFTEGLIDDPSRIRAIDIHHEPLGIIIDVSDPSRTAEATDRLLAGRSGCGICGVRSLEDAMRCAAEITPRPAIEAAAIQQAVGALGQHQPLNQATRATHAAAFCDAGGRILAVREDVGRHNALDKLIGHLLRKGVSRHQGFVLITSRCSYEMAQKTARADIGTLAAISAPTALALALAREAGLTLIAVARPDSHILFTQPEGRPA